MNIFIKAQTSYFAPSKYCIIFSHSATKNCSKAFTGKIIGEKVLPKPTARKGCTLQANYSYMEHEIVKT